MWSAESYDGGGEEEEVVEVVEEVGIVDDAAVKAEREAAEKLAAAREYAIGRDQFITAAVDPGYELCFIENSFFFFLFFLCVFFVCGRFFDLIPSRESILIEFLIFYFLFSFKTVGTLSLVRLLVVVSQSKRTLHTMFH